MSKPAASILASYISEAADYVADAAATLARAAAAMKEAEAAPSPLAAAAMKEAEAAPSPLAAAARESVALNAPIHISPPPADPVAALAAANGLEVWNMGGNCLAYGKRRDNQTYLIICDKDNALPDSLEVDCIAGVYGNDGSDFICREDMRFADCITWTLASRAPLADEQTYLSDYKNSSGLPMPTVGACYLITQPIERFPWDIAKAGQLATVTEVTAETIWIRPHTLFAYADHDDAAHLNAVAFQLDGDHNGLAEFHDCCVLQSAADKPHPLAEDEAGREALASDAFDAAIQLIQRRLGVTSGDVGGVYFTGENEHAMKGILAGYIATEIASGDLKA